MRRLLDLVQAIELKSFAELAPETSERILAIRNEPEVRKNMYTDQEIGSNEHRAWMQRTIGRNDAKMFAVLLGDQVVGAIGLTSIVPVHRRAEWAFYVSKTTQGKGLGSALEFKFLDWVFSDERLHKLNCEVLSFNGPVIALHKRFGFREEGIRRDHIFRDGQWIDAVLLGITADEWSDQQSTLRERLFK